MADSAAAYSRVEAAIARYVSRFGQKALADPRVQLILGSLTKKRGSSDPPFTASRVRPVDR
jgi:hypothetical protein